MAAEHTDASEHRALLARLKRLEGQLRGLQRMIAEGKDCEQIARQFSAASAALRRAAFVFFASHMLQCVASPGRGFPDLDELSRLFVRFG